jgi:23S rRNA pseudouridine1911/1915/1917 synthase
LNQKQAILSVSDRVEEESDASVESEVEIRDLMIPIELHGDRLDRALATLLPEFSRSFARQLLDQGAVSAQQVSPQISPQVVSKPAQKVKAGERYQVELRPTPQSRAFIPEAMPLDIVYQDEFLYVINKPAGLVVHPAAGNWSGTLLNGLLALDEGAAMLPRAGIVHRLDKDTSGLMVVARQRRSMDRLVEMIAAREVHREYWAIGYRAWRGAATQEVDAAVGRDPKQRLRMAVVDLTHQSGKSAQTTIEVLDTNDQACWVACTLHTGRTHQIRVHMAHLGHPLLGDTLYGGPASMGIARQALHAFRLSFEHPMTGEFLTFSAPMPLDMGNLLEALSLRKP